MPSASGRGRPGGGVGGVPLEVDGPALAPVNMFAKLAKKLADASGSSDRSLCERV